MSIRRGPHGRCGGDRALVPSWIVAPILDLSVGCCSDCRSAEHHPKEIFQSLVAILLGSMLLLFVVLLHIPNLVRDNGARLFWAILLRGHGFQRRGLYAWPEACRRGRLLRHARAGNSRRAFFVGYHELVFGCEDFLHPHDCARVPLANNRSTWIPGHLSGPMFQGAVRCLAAHCIVVTKGAPSCDLSAGS